MEPRGFLWERLQSRLPASSEHSPLRSSRLIVAAEDSCSYCRERALGGWLRCGSASARHCLTPSRLPILSPRPMARGHPPSLLQATCGLLAGCTVGGTSVPTAPAAGTFVVMSVAVEAAPAKAKDVRQACCVPTGLEPAGSVVHSACRASAPSGQRAAFCARMQPHPPPTVGKAKPRLPPRVGVGGMPRIVRCQRTGLLKPPQHELPWEWPLGE
jgi:hypothetical protein